MRLRATRTTGLWSRRPRVRVPSLTPQDSPAPGDSPAEPDRSVRSDGDSSGTLSRDATPGTTPDSEASEPPIRFLGDEPELYLEFNHQLVEHLTAAVRASPEDIEDAAAFAWLQFFRYQPDRDQSWQGWLYRTAQREAWKLNAGHRREGLHIVHDADAGKPGLTREPPDPRDRLDERVELLAALEELRHLPSHLRRVVLLRSQVNRHAELAEVLGVTTGRVGQLLQQVTVRQQERAERRAELERPVANPRAARLRELELESPEWLVEAIGRAPTFNKTSSKVLLAWRRAALVIDDYRNTHGWDHQKLGIGPTPIHPAARRAHQLAERAVADVHEERHLRKRGHSLER